MKKVMLFLLILAVCSYAVNNIKLGDKYFKINDFDNAFKSYIAAYNNEEDDITIRFERFIRTESDALKYLKLCEKIDKNFSFQFVNMLAAKHYPSLIKKYGTKTLKRILLSDMISIFKSSIYSQDIIEKALSSGYSDDTIKQIFNSKFDNKMKERIFENKYPETLITKTLSSQVLDKLLSFSPEFSDKVFSSKRPDDVVINLLSSKFSENTIIKLLYSRYSDNGINSLILSDYSDDIVGKLLSKNYNEEHLVFLTQNPLSVEIITSNYSDKTKDSLISCLLLKKRSDDFIGKILSSEYSESFVDSVVASRFSEKFLNKLLQLKPPEEKVAALFESKLEEDILNSYIFNFPLDLCNLVIEYPVIKLMQVKEEAENKNILAKEKDQFETKDQYKNRQKIAKIKLDEINTKYDKMLTELKNKINTELNSPNFNEEDFLRKKLQYDGIDLRLSIDSLGGYDPDKQYYTVTINGITDKVRMPADDAKIFSLNYKDTKIEALKRVKDDFSGYRPFNIFIKHKNLMQDYQFGKHEEDMLTSFSSNRIADIPVLIIGNPITLDPNHSGILDAGETINIEFPVTNTGKGIAYTVVVDIELPSDFGKGITVSNQIQFAMIRPSETQIAKFKLTGDLKIGDSTILLTVNAKEANKFHADPNIIHIKTSKIKEPDLVIFGYDIKSENGLNKLIPKSSPTIVARIFNKGEGDATNVAVKLSTKEPDKVFFQTGTKFNIVNIKSHEFKDIEFGIALNAEVKDSITLVLVLEEKLKTKTENLSILVDKEKSKMAEYFIEATNSNTGANLDDKRMNIDIENGLPKTNKIRKDAIGIIYGVENYKDIDGVKWAVRDALWAKEYFVEVLGIPRENIRYKVNDEVTQSEFTKVFNAKGWLDSRVTSDSTEIYFYYAGHGFPDVNNDNKPYLIPFDGDPNYPTHTGYNLDELFANLSNLKAKSVTVFLDACFSGASRENKMLLADARPAVLPSSKSANFNNSTVFSSSSGSQVSTYYPEKKHGLFTYYLLKAFKGEADSNKDNLITVGEIESYIIENVRKTAGRLDKTQIPEVHSKDKNRVLIDLK